MRKHFQHNFVEQVELQEETTDKGRHYITPSGDRLPSVTTVLAQHTDNTWLVEWKKRVGEVKAKQISNQALRRGRAIHEMAEKYVRNFDYDNVMPIYRDLFKPIKCVLDRSVDHIYGVELPLFSKALGTAGRTDLVAKYDDTISIIDYKTSKRIKNEGDILSYFLQSTAYSLMFERTYNIWTPQIVIIMTVEDEPEPQVFVHPRAAYVDQVLDIFMPTKEKSELLNRLNP